MTLFCAWGYFVGKCTLANQLNRRKFFNVCAGFFMGMELLPEDVDYQSLRQNPRFSILLSPNSVRVPVTAVPTISILVRSLVVYKVLVFDISKLLITFTNTMFRKHQVVGMKSEIKYLWFYLSSMMKKIYVTGNVAQCRVRENPKQLNKCVFWRKIEANVYQRTMLTILQRIFFYRILLLKP